MYVKLVISCFLLGVVVTVFIGSFLIKGIFSNINWSKIYQYITKAIKHIESLWYVFLFVVSTIYIIINFEECKKFSFFSDFDGENVIFIFWLIMLILPFFEKFEVLGIGYKWRQRIGSEEAARQAMDQNHIMTQEELQNINSAQNNE